MNPEIPYALYLKFLKPTESVSLVISLESLGLVCLGEERIDEAFSIVHYHFKSDTAKKVVLHLEIEDNCSERLNISIYNGAEHDILKEMFAFFNHFDPDKIALVDQEIKNTLYIKDMHTFASTAEATDISQDWISNTEKQATLTLGFDDFYTNPFNLARRDVLLGKSSVSSM